MAGLDLSCPATPSDTGAYRLSWNGPAGAEYRLTENAGDGSRIVYEGPDTASTVTGRGEGDYTYRLEVLAPGGAPGGSASCSVEVAPPSLSLAFGLFGLGLFICLATITLITRGHRRHRRGELG